jgi:hypothetical protein
VRRTHGYFSKPKGFVNKNVWETWAARSRGWNPDRGERLFSPAKQLPTGLWGPSTILFSGYRGSSHSVADGYKHCWVLFVEYLSSHLSGSMTWHSRRPLSLYLPPREPQLSPCTHPVFPLPSFRTFWSSWWICSKGIMQMKMPDPTRDTMTKDWRKLHSVHFSNSGEKGWTLNSDRSEPCRCVCVCVCVSEIVIPKD